MPPLFVVCGEIISVSDNLRPLVLAFVKWHTIARLCLRLAGL